MKSRLVRLFFCSQYFGFGRSLCEFLPPSSNMKQLATRYTDECPSITTPVNGTGLRQTRWICHSSVRPLAVKGGCSLPLVVAFIITGATPSFRPPFTFSGCRFKCSLCQPKEKHVTWLQVTNRKTHSKESSCQLQLPFVLDIDLSIKNQPGFTNCRYGISYG